MDSTAHMLHLRARIGLLAVFAAACLTFGVVAQASATTFDPEQIISNDNMRDYDSMSQKDIQAFLETQDGALASLVTSDYDQVITLSKTKTNWNATPDRGEKPKSASRIIWEACQAWKINPKVMLAMLQKEQSLITTKPEPGSSTLARAVGAGCPGRLVDPEHNKVATNKYPGFGNQIWYGARLLDGYGEGKNGSTIPLFFPGITVKDIYRTPQVTLHPSNVATYKLYIYNPSIGAKAPYGDLSGRACTGNANFWKIYRKYFGSTYANTQLRRVFRFKSRSNGTYYYTTSIAQRYHLASEHTKSWVYGGVTFSMDTSVPASAVKPVYRFYNKGTHKYSYIRYGAKYRARRSASGRKTWKFDGVAFRVSTTKGPDSVPLYRLYNRRNGAYLLTSSAPTVAALRKTAALRRMWQNQGIVYYLPRMVVR
jgi:hypothetical protein